MSNHERRETDISDTYTGGQEGSWSFIRADKPFYLYWSEQLFKSGWDGISPLTYAHEPEEEASWETSAQTGS